MIPGFRVADKGEITLLENDVMEDMLEDYYQKGDEQFIKLIDAYGTGRNDANIEEIIKKIYALARSNPWPDEWYEQVLDTYTSRDNGSNKVLANLYESIVYSISDYKKKYEYMIEVCNRQMDRFHILVLLIQTIWLYVVLLIHRILTSW